LLLSINETARLYAFVLHPIPENLMGKRQATVVGRSKSKVPSQIVAGVLLIEFAAISLLSGAQTPQPAVFSCASRSSSSQPSSSKQAASQEPSQTVRTQKPAAADDNGPSLPRGKKLMLKDGSFHLVREYQIQGDRVRYYSTERSQWEEIPAALVDWEATRNVESEQSKRDAAMVAKLAAQEEARRIEPLDIDASLEAAPGVFIPPGEGLFAFDGKAVVRLSQALTESKLDKKRLLEQVLVPIKVVPSRHTISVEPAHAKFRVSTGQPEFYMRTADAREPNMDLIRTKVHGATRTIENLDEIFKQQTEVRDSLPLQRWEVARGVYRYTLGKPLDPGEYAFIEIVQGEGMSLYVWDFGVDADGSEKPRAQKQQ
jgi:hypothetical protein